MRKLLENHRANPSALPLIGGHRGCKCSFVENTIPALEEGLRQGASYLEIDIQLTKDNIPVVFHDIDLKDKTGLDGLVQQYTLAQIKERWPIETLENVMRWGKKNDVYFALEMKAEPAFTHGANMALIGPMIDIVKGEGMLENVEAFGIDYRVLKEIHSMEKRFDIGLIVPAVHPDPVALMKEYDALIYLSYAFMTDAETVSKLQNAGCYVSGAILSNEKYIHHACSTKMDMFEHDFPEKALSLIRAFDFS